jgi:hypothetical protein
MQKCACNCFACAYLEDKYFSFNGLEKVILDYLIQNKVVNSKTPVGGYLQTESSSEKPGSRATARNELKRDSYHGGGVASLASLNLWVRRERGPE